MSRITLSGAIQNRLELLAEARQHLSHLLDRTYLPCILNVGTEITESKNATRDLLGQLEGVLSIEIRVREHLSESLDVTETEEPPDKAIGNECLEIPALLTSTKE